MHRYEIATPRLAVGTAAVALTALALGVLVIIPATMEVDAREMRAEAAAVAAQADRSDSRTLLAQHEIGASPCIGSAVDDDRP